MIFCSIWMLQGTRCGSSCSKNPKHSRTSAVRSLSWVAAVLTSSKRRVGRDSGEYFWKINLQVWSDVAEPTHPLNLTLNTGCDAVVLGLAIQQSWVSTSTVSKGFPPGTMLVLWVSNWVVDLSPRHRWRDLYMCFLFPCVKAEDHFSRLRWSHSILVFMWQIV